MTSCQRLSVKIKRIDKYMVQIGSVFLLEINMTCKLFSGKVTLISSDDIPSCPLGSVFQPCDTIYLGTK